MSRIDIDAFSAAYSEELYTAWLFHDEAALGSLRKDLEVEYFKGKTTQYLVRFLLGFWDEYHTLPLPEHLLLNISTDLEKQRITEDEGSVAIDVYQKLAAAYTDPPSYATINGPIKAHAVEWLQTCALDKALRQTVEEGENGALRPMVAAQRFQEIAAIGTAVDTAVPHFGVADRAAFQALFAADTGHRVGVGMPELDWMIAGGLRAGELGVWMAPTGKGKSHALVFTGRNVMLQGLRVLHVTLEMDSLSVVQRYWSGMVGIDANEIPSRLTDVMRSFDEDGRADLYADFWVERYPMRSASVNTLRALVHRVRTEQEFLPDVLIVDYADLLRPDGGRKDAAQWESQGTVYEELRALAVEENLIVWTAAQTNRQGHTVVGTVGMEHIGDSYAKARVADLIISITHDRENARIQPPPREVRVTLATPKVRNGVSDQQLVAMMNGARSTFTFAPQEQPDAAPAPDDGDGTFQQQRAATGRGDVHA